MNATAIEYIWQAIQESERSDELQFMNARGPVDADPPDRIRRAVSRLRRSGLIRYKRIATLCQCVTCLLL